MGQFPYHCPSHRDDISPLSREIMSNFHSNWLHNRPSRDKNSRFKGHFYVLFVNQLMICFVKMWGRRKNSQRFYVFLNFSIISNIEENRNRTTVASSESVLALAIRLIYFKQRDGPEKIEPKQALSKKEVLGVVLMSYSYLQY